MKQCLVTGGAGFIGSHLVEALVKLGHHVTVIDNFSNGKEINLESSSLSGRITVINADVSDHLSITPYFEGIDWVFHLAALADIVPSIQRPLEYHKANVDGTISVLEAARKSGIKRFLYAASSSCYGIPLEYPTYESAAINPMYPYALTKFLGEQYVLHWFRTYNLPVLSLRLFNVYGPRSRTSGTYGAVFGVFLAQKLAGKPYTIVGDGTQTRDFTYVTDVVDAFIRAAESEIAGEIFNVGSGGTYSVNELVSYLGGNKEYIPKRPGEPDCTYADISKITAQLGWVPKVTFKDGVSRMLDSIHLWKDAPVWDRESIKEATKDWFQYLSNPGD